MIKRSSKLKLNYVNLNKQKFTDFLFDNHSTNMCVNLINELIYSTDKIPALLPKEVTNKLPYSSRVNQLLAKECSSIARSIRNKLSKIKSNSNLQKYQQELLETFKNKTLKVNSISQLNLDQRFVDIQVANDTCFDYWIMLQFPQMGKVYLPFKITRHIQNLINRGYTLKTNTLRIKRNGEVELFFYKEPAKNNNVESIGIDVGRNKSFITSRNETEHLTKDILNSFKKQKHGSKLKASRVRKLKQIIDYFVKNNINWLNLKQITLENLNDIKRYKKWGNINHHWSSRYIQNRIRLLAEEHNVYVKLIHPAYTSQTCSGCGFKHKNNRKAELFECLNCGFEIDADLNAAINIHNKGQILPLTEKIINI